MTKAFLEDYQFRLEHHDQTFFIDGEPEEANLKRLDDRLWQALYGNASYDVFIQKIDPESREVTLSINGKRTTVRIQTRIEQLLKDLGLEHAMAKKLDSLKAPMPGLIHSLKVTEGQEVKKGDPLLILEAMKMENVIKSPGEGTVTRIHVKEKASVEKNTLLISFG
jgi:biotin carboxyl carrier protein